MSQKLKPLLLPLLAEERKKRESIAEMESEFTFSSFRTQNYSNSDISTPVTPTFSARSHIGFPSSSSSIDSHYTPPFISSPPCSISYMRTKTSKTSLPDVQEEIFESEESPDTSEDDESTDLYYCLCDHNQCFHRDPIILPDSTLGPSCVRLSSNLDVEYDLTDAFFGDGDYFESAKCKKRGIGETPLTGFATRLGTKFPMFTRRWRTKARRNVVAAPTSCIAPVQTCSRSSSISNSALQGSDSHNSHVTLSSIYDERSDRSTTSNVDVYKAGSYDHMREEAASTPLLPPLMMDASANTRQVSLQSPLQSPSVAEVNESLAEKLTPLDLNALPPLCTKPSTSSFSIPRSKHYLSPSELPPITIADPDDEWANKLGHANFTIFPEPHLPQTFDLQSCRQLRYDWDLACCNYKKHLVRTGEHYGLTSRTNRFTEEKWASINEIWRTNFELAVSNMAKSGDLARKSLKNNSLDEVDIMAKIPSLSDLRNGNKFPLLSDEDIVGPMVQASSTLRRHPTTKARVMKYLTAKLSFPK